MPHDANALDHLAVEEVVRLLGRRPDGIVASAVIAAIQARYARCLTAIYIDQGRVYVDYVCRCCGEPAHIDAPFARVDAASCPDGVALQIVSGAGAERRSEVFYVSL